MQIFHPFPLSLPSPFEFIILLDKPAFAQSRLTLKYPVAIQISNPQVTVHGNKTSYQPQTDPGGQHSFGKLEHNAAFRNNR